MKKLAKLVLILAALMLCLSACGSVTTVDLSPYLSVSYSGFNGNGAARVDFGFASFEFGIMSQWKQNERADKLPGLTAVETTIAYAADVSQNLKNGDVITVKITYNEELAKQHGYAFTGLEKQFTVEGLPEAIQIDPFAEDVFGADKAVRFSAEGIDPFIILTLRNTAPLTDPIRQITYTASKDWNLQNNDVITVTAEVDEKFAAQGYALTRNQYTFTVDGFDRYISAPADLTADVLQRMADRACQECLYGGNVDIYDGINAVTPWAATVDNVRVADTALLAVNNELETEYSFLLVPVTKTVTTSEWYDMDAGMNTVKTWENVIGYYKFTDITVLPDGTVTFNESYAEFNGSFTDANVANALYLSQFADRYTFTEVPMP